MAGIDWNTHFPSVIGNEHIEANYKAFSINKAAFASQGLTFRARHSGAINAVDLFADNGASAPLVSPSDNRYGGLQRPMYCEIVPAGSEPMAIAVDTFNPTAITGSGVVNENLTTPVTVSRILANDDSLFIASPSLSGYFDVQFDTSAFPLDRHVLGIVVMVHVNATYRLSRGDPGFLPGTTSPGHQWYRDIPTLAPRTVQTEVTTGEAKLDQGESAWTHWTAQDIRDFRSAATGGTRFWRVRCRAAPGGWRVDEVKMRVIWAPERRVAVGLGTPSTSFDWNRFTLATPPATGSPSLTVGNDYSLLVRRIAPYSVDQVDASVLPWRHLRGFPLDAHWQARPVEANSLAIIDIGDPVEGIACARFVTGAAVTADAQPYSLHRSGRVWGSVQASQTITVTGAASAVTYGQVFVTAGWNPANGRPEGPLRCEVIRVADGVRVFNPIEVSASDVDRLPTSAVYSDTDDQSARYKTIQFRFAESQVLTPGTYRILIQSPGTTEDRSWRVGALIANDVDSPDQTWSVAGIAGGSNAATGTWVSSFSGDEPLTSVPDNISSDLLATLAAVPAAVTGAATSIGTLTAHHAEICSKTAECNGCADQTVPFIAITWSPSASGDPDVSGYDVDRMDPLSPDWERVAFVGGRLNTRWEDHEARIGVSTSYRIRAVLSSGIAGDWSATVSALQPVGQIALSFTSNAATGMGVAYPEVWETREVTRLFSFDEFKDVTLQTIYARNRPIASHPIERQGDSFTRTVLVSAGCSVTLPSLGMFRPMRDLAWAPIPYVCVRDGEGNRWFANIQVPNGSGVRPGERWLAEMLITEIADSPDIHQTSAAQVSQPTPLGSVL